MTRLGITFEEVALAAEQITQEGEKPTIEKIRTNLGGTGSNSTIAKYFNEWKHQNAAHQDNQQPAVFSSNLVDFALKRAWDQLNQETANKIEIIQKEAQEQINTIKNTLLVTENNFNKLREDFNQLNENLNQVSAEKELVLLDLKSLREEHRLLQERYQALDEKYTEMQHVNNQHINHLIAAHNHETAQIEEKSKQQSNDHEKFISEMKTQYEAERQQHVLLVDSLKVTNQQRTNSLKALENTLKEKEIKIIALITENKFIILERDSVLAQLTQQENQLKWMMDKSLIDSKVVDKINTIPIMTNALEKLDLNMNQIMSDKFKEMNDSIKQLRELKVAVIDE